MKLATNSNIEYTYEQVIDRVSLYGPDTRRFLKHHPNITDEFFMFIKAIEFVESL
jgi:hypothetical protein